MILLMEGVLHQLRLVVYPIIYKVLYIPGGPGFLPSTVAGSICLFHTTWTPRGSTDVFWLRYFTGIKWNLLATHQVVILRVSWFWTPTNSFCWDVQCNYQVILPWKFTEFAPENTQSYVKLRECSGLSFCQDHFFAWFTIEPWKKKLITFHFSGWLIGILMLVYYNPHITE